ncbi:MATE family efflux transporter [Flavivirga jejuensis]|uniref:Multidrug export protein MepA n=1 Tax=Flavivirga jejuensis TaxID=870487 RepID=A0ABT8WT32_9FLAO|nr:MATE family efflux transporter [Flavivirga jejuensis]MDO5976343.1 MATE family efflux transporter [Flavivirga jejuensis]
MDLSLKDKQKQLILKEPLHKVMWKMSIPAIVAMVLYGLNAFMDTIYVGQLLNEEALAGVAIAYPLTGIMLGFGSWVGTGAGNYISILLGKNDNDILIKVIPNATLFTLIGTLIFAIPSYIFSEELIAFMGGSGTVLKYGTCYLEITLLASPLWVYALQLNFIVRAEGKMKTAAIIMAYGLVINIILTPIFINYFNMGIGGAAWATNIGMFIYCIVGYLYYKNGKASFVANINLIRYDKEIFLKIIKLGFPGFIMSLMGLIQAAVVFNAIVNVGTERDLAFFAAANRIMLFLMTPLFGLMRALQPVAGVNFGAAQYTRVKQSFLLFSKTGLWLILPFWMFLMAFPELNIKMVLPNMVLTPADVFNFRIYMAILPFLPYVFMALTYLPAINRPKPASIIGVARQVLFYVPIMIFLPKYIGIKGIYYGATLIDIVITFWIVYVVWKTFSTVLTLKK